MRKAPIILIPGIQGTTLTNINNKDFSKVFSGIKKNFVNIHNIELQADGKSDVGRENIVERSDVEDLAYSEIINYFRSRGFSVYIFGYDWRRSNQDSAVALDYFIKALTNKLNTSKFNFVTHSMGGLVLSAYLRILGASDQIDRVVNRAIFTVPPFLGSMEAAVNMIVGKSMLINSSDDVRKVVRTFPSIYELFPVYPGALIREQQNAIVDYTNYDQFWQHNAGDLSHVIPSVKAKAEKKKRLIAKRFNDVKALRSHGRDSIFDFSTLDATVRKRIIVLGGTEVETITQVKILDRGPGSGIVNFFDFENGKHGSGDGTVPISSVDAFKDVIDTYAVENKPWETRYNSFFILNDWHSFFLNNGRVQNIIKRFLEWDESSLVGNWFTSSADGVMKIT